MNKYDYPPECNTPELRKTYRRQYRKTNAYSNHPGLADADAMVAVVNLKAKKAKANPKPTPPPVSRLDWIHQGGTSDLYFTKQGEDILTVMQRTDNPGYRAYITRGQQPMTMVISLARDAKDAIIAVEDIYLG